MRKRCIGISKNAFFGWQVGHFYTAITEKQRNMAVFRSLPKLYEGMVVILENHMDNFTVEDIYARIVREEDRIERAGMMQEMHQVKNIAHLGYYLFVLHLERAQETMLLEN